MGQLIKLEDYVSRYEQNIFLYPSRFVRLKRQQWNNIQNAWENDELDILAEEQRKELSMVEEEKEPLLSKMKGLLKLRKRENEILEDMIVMDQDQAKDEMADRGLKFSTTFPVVPESLEELKKQFLDQLLRFQLKWASSTLTEKSFLNKKYLFDEKLNYFLQRFPDTYLIMYNPIFLLQQAPVEVDIIIVSPTEAICLSFVEEEQSAVFIGSKERFWLKRYQDEEKKVLNPLLSLNRTEKIVRKIFETYEIDLPIQKLVMSRTGYIDYPTAPYDVQFVERRSYDKWFQAMRSNRTPLKHTQLKAAQALLQYCQTTSIKRYEWEISDDL
ncbi:NERD domain-containing protein [Cytobacillus spongiae]|uniref:nuclease-related domain-containing protein n=1 Tax=Cytobacillus spongiae TaxID=2901381 RepID=UPI001F335FFC|nr:nuclease-related domain-containing protein [Cytobacillus spongiae]UII55244.1 NERD domain-containing protein [Cytobacillus spongiae]